MEVASEQPKANGSKAFLGTDAVSRYVHGDLSLPGWREIFPPKIVVILRDSVFSPQKNHTMHVILRDTGGICLSTGNLFQMQIVVAVTFGKVSRFLPSNRVELQGWEYYLPSFG